MKIIRIDDGCKYCPYTQYNIAKGTVCIIKLKQLPPSMEKGYFPDWCPLEDMPQSLMDLWMTEKRKDKAAARVKAVHGTRYK